ncbi:flagellar biosynthetic protein FliR [uncultured Erythrobacter sp.]|uniref:flagellar biosynthetic protein FliR n=1 Tax=uncultured Erythrobacter sp. TaxID=263913 RepID=UPI002612B483|nr:flagellar biosynthetic protein FliR [uncultured Erythrobacter sp.]
MTFLDLGFDTLLEQLWQLLFLSIRCGAAMIAAPMVGGMVMPAMARLMAAFVIAIFVGVWIPVPELPDMLSFAAILAVLQEVIIGAALGFVLQIAFAVPLIAAEQIAGTMGLAIATSIDPASGAQSGALGSFFGLILTLLFYIIGGHLLWFRLIMESYRFMPAGITAFGGVEAQSIVTFAGYCIATAAAISLPVILVLLCVQLITGTISRAAPALNLFALGLPAGTLAGITAMIVVMPIFVEQFTDLLQAALEQSAAIFTPGLDGLGRSG